MNQFNCCLFKYVESIKNDLYIIFLHSLGNCFKQSFYFIVFNVSNDIKLFIDIDL